MKQIVVIVAFLVGAIGFSQESKKAETLLNEVYDKVSNYENISIDFNRLIK